jgi:hypothetical protein
MGVGGDFPLSLQHRVASNNRVLSWRQGSIVATKTKFTFQEFQKLPEREGAIYELDEGELLVEPSPALRHNLVRQRIAMKLMQFVESRSLGIVIEEMDFRLSPDTVRNPDVAFITREHLQSIDLDRSPVDGAPALAVEVISPSNHKGYEGTRRKARFENRSSLVTSCSFIRRLYCELTHPKQKGTRRSNFVSLCVLCG